MKVVFQNNDSSLLADIQVSRLLKPFFAMWQWPVKFSPLCIANVLKCSREFLNALASYLNSVLFKKNHTVLPIGNTSKDSSQTPDKIQTSPKHQFSQKDLLLSSKEKLKQLLSVSGRKQQQMTLQVNFFIIIICLLCI